MNRHEEWENYLKSEFYSGREEFLETEAGQKDFRNQAFRRYNRAVRHFIPWIKRAVTLESTKILEFGCGTGSSTLALCQHGCRVVGTEILPRSLETARRRLEFFEFSDNAELHLVESAPDYDKLGNDFDAVVFYAVFEHMLIPERLDALRIAREKVKPGGLLVLLETPNRLSYFESHTIREPFAHMLPPELLLEYAKKFYEGVRSKALVKKLEHSIPIGREALTRAGVDGLSYHELEVVLGMSLHQNIVLDGWEPEMLQMFPPTLDDYVLATYLEKMDPRVNRGFARSVLSLCAKL